MQAVDGDIYHRESSIPGVTLLVHHSIILYNVHADVTVNYLRFRESSVSGRAHDDGTVCARNGE